MGKKHALLSPSGAKRWLTCSPSALLESKLPDRSSKYADEGTLAHHLSELLIAYHLGFITDTRFNAELTVIKTRQYYSISLHQDCEEFRSYVIEQYNKCRAIDKNAVIFLETVLNLTRYIPEGFGTADITIVYNGGLIVIDLKYGAGVPVDCEENEQLMIYGLGAMDRYGWLFDIHIVELHIYQPRIGNISSWSITAEGLLKWSADVLIPGAMAAYKGEGDFVPGDHCQFCRARPRCEALTKYVLTAYKPLQIPGLITPEQVSEVLLKEDLIKKWLTTVSEYALTEALQKGVKWPGFKLVAGTSRRVIKDEKKAVQILQDNGFKKSDITTTGLKSLGELEALTGKKVFAEMMEPVIHKPAGKPTLVPKSDKREELDSAETAFKDIQFEED